jgi:hypothetical protein
MNKEDYFIPRFSLYHHVLANESLVRSFVLTIASSSLQYVYTEEKKCIVTLYTYLCIKFNKNMKKVFLLKVLYKSYIYLYRI